MRGTLLAKNDDSPAKRTVYDEISSDTTRGKLRYEKRLNAWTIPSDDESSTDDRIVVPRSRAFQVSFEADHEDVADGIEFPHADAEVTLNSLTVETVDGSRTIEESDEYGLGHPIAYLEDIHHYAFHYWDKHLYDDGHRIEVVSYVPVERAFSGVLR